MEFYSPHLKKYSSAEQKLSKMRMGIKENVDWEFLEIGGK